MQRISCKKTSITIIFHYLTPESPLLTQWSSPKTSFPIELIVSPQHLYKGIICSHSFYLFSRNIIPITNKAFFSFSTRWHPLFPVERHTDTERKRRTQTYISPSTRGTTNRDRGRCYRYTDRLFLCRVQDPHKSHAILP